MVLSVLTSYALAASPVLQTLGEGTVNWTTLELCTSGSAVNATGTMGGYETLEGRVRSELGPRMLDLARLVRFDHERTTGDLMAAAEAVAEKLDSNVSLWGVTEARYFTSGRVDVDVCLPMHAWLRPALTQGAAGVDRGSPPTLPWTGLVVDARGLAITPALAPRLLAPSGAVLYGLERMTEFAASQRPPVVYVYDPADPIAVRRAGEHPLLLPAAEVKGEVDLVLDAASTQALEDAVASAGFLPLGTVVVVISR